MDAKKKEDFFNEKRAWYKTVKQVFCPCLQECIIFNSKGFHHLRFDSKGRQRSVKEQIYRLGLLPLVIPVIKNANKIFLYKPPEYSKVFDKYVEYWALQEVVGKSNATVKVILRKIGDGNITFHSVMKKNDKPKKLTNKKVA